MFAPRWSGGEGRLDAALTQRDIPAALREQLGLKLEPRTGRVDVLVADRAEYPTPN